jgi:hypothetical protein
MKWLKAGVIFWFLFPNGLAAQDPIVLFPGDTNNDGVCDYLDIFSLGLNYGNTFEPRDEMGINWTPKLSEAWPFENPVSGINAGFSDCNGDGFIDEEDLAALQTNNDSSQMQSIPPPENWTGKLTDSLFSAPPVVFTFLFDRDTAYIGDTLTALFTYEIPPFHPSGAMAVGWWITYEADLVEETSVRVFPDSMNNDLMFIATTSLGTNVWKGIPPGNIQFGASGKAMNALQGSDTLCSIRFIIEDKILALENPFSFDCQAFLCINKDEIVLPNIVNKNSCLVFGKHRPVSVKNFERAAISVYPNPSPGLFEISGLADLLQIKVFDPSLNLILEKEIQPNTSFQVDLSSFSKGIYLLKGVSSKKIYSQKLLNF